MNNKTDFLNDFYVLFIKNLEKMWMFGEYYSSGQKVLDKDGDLGEVWISGYEFAHNIQ